ncbi:hypothetical protein P7C71_g2669, partial [Lecanoromycetidae sp. Uapishka_2]
MSLSIPRKRLLHSATFLVSQSHFLPFLIPCLSAHRQISFNPFRRRDREILDPKTLDTIKKGKDAKKPRARPQTGDLAPSSIFNESDPSTSKDKDGAVTVRRDPHVMAAALDPTPHTRKRWQRKMVIRDIRGRGRLNKTEKILRTERSHLAKSPWIKTSVKKLFPLARQIAGKPLTDAMIQMRFSKKKAAGDVLKHLEYARDQAVVMRGMGLGKVAATDVANGEAEGEKAEEERLVVEDKKGKRRVVTDRSAMYVDEAWVGRGKYESGSDHRARGQIHRLRLPYTSISVVLKEEATRIRLADEREQKRQRKKVWVPLPDRPITAQRQYPLW